MSSKSKINSKTVIAFVTLLIAIIWIWLGVFKYGLVSEENIPLPGFFPTIVAIILAVSSVIAVLQSLKEEKVTYEIQALYVGIGAMGVVGLTMLIGMLPALLIFFLGWVIFIEKMPKKTIIIATIVMVALVYGVFVIWLGVPFPKGLLFESL